MKYMKNQGSYESEAAGCMGLLEFVGKNPNLILHNVLNIPSFKHNLLSINKITQISNLSAKFLANKCLLQDLVSKAQGGLYILEVNHDINSHASHTLLSDMYLSWHSRLGHISKNKLLHIPELSLTFDKPYVCEICQSAK